MPDEVQGFLNLQQALTCIASRLEKQKSYITTRGKPIGSIEILAIAQRVLDKPTLLE